MILTSILDSINGIFGFIKKHPKFFLGVIFALLIVLLFKQCDNIKGLKNEIEIKEVEYENEKNRFFNNIKNLKDSVEFVEEDNIYIKSLLRVKEGELKILDSKLNDSKMLSTEQKLWFQTPRSPEEFYDLRNDPFELKNLIEDKNYLRSLSKQ